MAATTEAMQMSKFKPGQSGNPKGRPKSAFLDNYDSLQAKRTMINQGSQLVAENWPDIVYSMIEQAIKGNVQAAVFIRDTFIGKPKETVQHDVSEEAKEGLKLAYNLGVNNG